MIADRSSLATSEMLLTVVPSGRTVPSAGSELTRLGGVLSIRIPLRASIDSLSNASSATTRMS